MTFSNQVKTFSEINSIKNNKEIFNKMGRKCFIISSKSSAKKSGALDDVINVLKEYGIGYEIFDDIKQNPTVASCIEAGRKANEFKADFLIGIGGGSPLDATKTASIVATNPSINEDGIYAQAWVNKPLAFILVGTTAGTGSEVTKVSVLTNKHGNKKSIHNDDIYAKYSFGDPRYTESMPENIQVSTAFDALAHLLESHFSNKANDISKSYSIEGISKLFPYLIKINKKEKLTLEDRKVIYDISILGGLAIDITGTTFCHSLGYYFTENFHIAHGFACALFLNNLIDYEYKNNKEYTNSFFNKVNINKEDLKKEIAKSISFINNKLTDSDLDIIKERYSNNNSVKNTFGKMNVEDIISILKEGFI